MKGRYDPVPTTPPPQGPKHVVLAVEHGRAIERALQSRDPVLNRDRNRFGGAFCNACIRAIRTCSGRSGGANRRPAPRSLF